MYRDCKVHCEEANRHLVRFAMYRQMCNCEFNLNLSKLEKDQCHLCEYNKILAEKRNKKLIKLHSHHMMNISEKEKENDK